MRVEHPQHAIAVIARCVVDLGDYTTLIRGRILYNHLYYSQMSREYVDAIVTSRAYRTIARHANYSPRIVEYMTDLVNVRSLAPAAEVWGADP